VGSQPWLDDDGTVIGWRPIDRVQARNRMLVFHGNAGYALHRNYFVTGLQGLGDQWEVFLFEYPGYGAREGQPSEARLKAAAVQALELLLATNSRPLFITGESLGSGIATHLAAAFPDQVAGLLLVTPFSSLTDVAAHHFPYLPVRSLLSERYDSVEALSHYGGPVAFLLAGFTAAIALAALAFEAYLLTPGLKQAIPENAVASIVILLAALVHGMRVRNGATLQNAAVILYALFGKKRYKPFDDLERRQ